MFRKPESLPLFLFPQIPSSNSVNHTTEYFGAKGNGQNLGKSKRKWNTKTITKTQFDTSGDKDIALFAQSLNFSFFSLTQISGSGILRTYRPVI